MEIIIQKERKNPTNHDIKRKNKQNFARILIIQVNSKHKRIKILESTRFNVFFFLLYQALAG